MSSTATTSSFADICQLINNSNNQKDKIMNPSLEDHSPNSALDFTWLLNNANQSIHNPLLQINNPNQSMINTPNANQSINQLMSLNPAWAALCMATMCQPINNQQINENNHNITNHNQSIESEQINRTNFALSSQSPQSTPSPNNLNHSNNHQKYSTPIYSNPLSTQYNLHLLKGAGQKKQTRPTFNANQIHELELQFDQSQYLNGESRAELAKKLHMQQGQVKVWFQNRRTKYRKQQAGQRAQHRFDHERRMKNNAIDLTHSQLYL